jgi:hypothetical protein
MTAAPVTLPPSRTGGGPAGLDGRRARRRGRRTAGPRRALILAVLAVAMIIGAALPSSASFSESVSLPVKTIGTATVGAPTGVDVTYRCLGWGVEVTLDWNLSSTRRGVTGYEIRTYVGTASQVQARLGSTATTWTANADRSFVNGNTFDFTVTTLTSYGWTAESVHTQQIAC